MTRKVSDQKGKEKPENENKVRGRARLPGGHAGRDAGAAAEPLRLTLLQAPGRERQARHHSPRIAQSTTPGPSGANRTPAAEAPGTPRRPGTGKSQPPPARLAPFN